MDFKSCQVTNPRMSLSLSCGLGFGLVIKLSGASKLASTYFTLFYRSVHVLYTGMEYLGTNAIEKSIFVFISYYF